MTVLPNGLRVITERMPGVRSASLGFWVGVGARDEPAPLSGVSHFLEHLLFKGTATRSAHDIAESIDAVGGEMNAFTAKEHTAFYARVPGTSLDLALGVLGDVLTAPALREADVDSERQVILEEIALEEDEPEERVHSLSHEALFPDHALGREVAGTVDTIEAMRRDDIAGFFAQWYRPANIVVAAAGDVEHDAVVDAVAEHFAALDPGARPVRSAPAATVDLEARLERPTEQAHVVLGWRAPDAHDPDRHALALLNHVLGGGMSSRLFEKIREERGLAYSVYSYSALYDDAGCLVAYAGTSPAHQAEVRDLMASTIAEVAAGGITDRELEVAKGYVRGALLLGLEDSASRMSRLGGNTLVHGSVMPLDDYLARIDAVTTEAVARVAAGVLGTPPSVATIAPRSGRRRA